MRTPKLLRPRIWRVGRWTLRSAFLFNDWAVPIGWRYEFDRDAWHAVILCWHVRFWAGPRVPAGEAALVGPSHVHDLHTTREPIFAATRYEWPFRSVIGERTITSCRSCSFHVEQTEIDRGDHGTLGS